MSICNPRSFAFGKTSAKALDTAASMPHGGIWRTRENETLNIE